MSKIDHTDILNARERALNAQQKMNALMQELCQQTKHLLADHAPLIDQAKDDRLRSQLARLYSYLPADFKDGKDLAETLEAIVDFWQQQEKLYRPRKRRGTQAAKK